jgi:hypothetical protein
MKLVKFMDNSDKANIVAKIQNYGSKSFKSCFEFCEARFVVS